MTAEPSRRVSVVLFDGFELLDVFGPLQMFGVLSPDCFEIVILGPHAGPVRSAQGPQAHADCAYEDAREPDIVFVPGGMGTRTLVKDGAFLTWLAGHADPAEFVMSVCTGSAVLAAAGLLDGYRATSNKRSFGWVSEQGIAVEWVSEARWVQDRNRWTSSGVAAGIDMALAFIDHLYGDDLGQKLADGTEYDRHADPTWDPFAAKNNQLHQTRGTSAG